MFVLLKEKLVQVSAQGRNTDLLSAHEIGAMIQAHLRQEKTGEVDGGMVRPTQSEGLNFAQGAILVMFLVHRVGMIKINKYKLNLIHKEFNQQLYQIPRDNAEGSCQSQGSPHL